MSLHTHYRASRGLRLAAVAITGVAILASCTPSPEQTSTLASADPASAEAKRGRRHRSTTTTTSAPTTTTPSTTTTTVAPPAASPQPVGPTGTWNLKFADEFSGTSLDLSKWRPNWFGSTDTSVTKPINDYEESCYDPSQVKVQDGLLHLTAIKLAAPKVGCVKKNGAAASYASGMLMSYYDYNFTYGYMEARINLPGAGGVPENWAAFWANGRDWPRTGEIDVMETLGGEPRWHFHYEDSTGKHRSYGSGYDLISPKTGWHTFGALWEPGKITFYFDGRAVGSVTSNVTSAPMYLILNHAVSNYISGPIKVPSTLQVDYVRHWQR
jgi:beta-glucanase (GH16 family)